MAEPIRGPMVRTSRSRFARPVDRFARLAGSVGLGVGLVVLLGWLIDIPTLKGVFPGLVLMQPNTALSLTLAGLALLWSRPEDQGPVPRRIGIGLALMVTTLGLLTLLEHATKLDLGIDLMLFGRVPGSDGPSSPGRMALMSSVCLSCLGLAQCLMNARRRFGRRAGESLLVAVILFTSLDLIGYVYGVRFLYMISAFSTMALHTAATLLLLAMGTLAARPGARLMGRLLAEDAGGWLLRNVLPVALSLPLILGGLRIMGESAGLYHSRFGSALLVLSYMITLAILLGWTAGHLSGLDDDRRQAERLAQQREQWLRTTLTSIGDAVIATDEGGRVTFLNPSAEKLTGWTELEAAGRRLDEVFVIVNESTREKIPNPALRSLEEGRIVGLANHTLLISRDGRERPIDDSGAPIRDDSAVNMGSVLVFRDVSDRRRQEGELEDRERQFRTLAESIPQLVWMAESDGKIVWYNRRWYDYTGTTFEQMQGWGWRSVHDPEELPKVMERWGASIASGQPFEMIFPLRGADGVFRPFLTRVMPFRDESGQVARWFGTNTDITETKRTEDELRDARSRLNSTLAAAEVGTWEFDVTRNRIWADSNLSRMIGLPPDVSVDGPLEAYTQAIHPDDRERVTGAIKRSIELDLAFEEEFRLSLPDGETRWVVARGQVRRDPSSQEVQMPGVVVDITGRKEMEQELRRIAADLSEMDHRKDEFLATLAHELRNPLAPIRNSLQIMKMAGDPKDFEESRNLMERQVTHMVRLIDDLMDISRITRNKMELRRERVALTTIIQHSVETSRPMIEAAGHRLVVILPDQPVLIDADLTRVSQVFSNLLNNAAKYTESDGEITIRGEVREDEVEVSVRDNGVGIPTEMLPEVFAMFTQVERSLERAQGGLGIGLSLVKTLVEMHGGTVEARSEGTGLGSEFVVRLPIARAVGPPPEVSRPAPEASERVNRLRILVVDDNVDSARSLARLLRLLGHETRTAHDGGQAVDVAEAYRPELIFLDIGLPVLNGYDVARAIRGQAWGQETAIIALTGWGQAGDRRRSEEAGIDHHLVKPVDPTVLESMLLRLSPVGSLTKSADDAAT